MINKIKQLSKVEYRILRKIPDENPEKFRNKEFSEENYIIEPMNRESLLLKSPKSPEFGLNILKKSIENFNVLQTNSDSQEQIDVLLQKQKELQQLLKDERTKSQNNLDNFEGKILEIEKEMNSNFLKEKKDDELTSFKENWEDPENFFNKKNSNNFINEDNKIDFEKLLIEKEQLFNENKNLKENLIKNQNEMKVILNFK